MMPAPLTALEQRLFERLEAAMMEGNLDGEREQAAMLAAVNDELARLGKAPFRCETCKRPSFRPWGTSTTSISSPSAARNWCTAHCSAEPA